MSLLQRINKQKKKCCGGGRGGEWNRARQKGAFENLVCIFEVCVHVKPNNFKHQLRVSDKTKE